MSATRQKLSTWCAWFSPRDCEKFLFRRARFDGVQGAAGFVQRRGDKLWRSLRDQAPEETAVAPSRCSALTDRRREIESNTTSGLDRGSEADRSETAAGHHEHLIRPAIGVEIQTGYLSEIHLHPVDARNRRRPDRVPQIDAILVDVRPWRRSSRRADVGSRLQKACAAGAHRDIVRGVVNGNRTRGIEDTIDRGSADVDDSQRRCRDDDGSKAKQQSERESFHLVFTSRSGLRCGPLLS